MLSTIYFRHNLAKEQEQKGQKNCKQQKLKPLSPLAEMQPVHEEEVQQHDNPHVDQIVHNQDCSQHSVAMLPQLQYSRVTTPFLFRNVCKMLRRKTEEGYLACRCQTAAYKQKDTASKSYPCPHRRL